MPILLRLEQQAAPLIDGGGAVGRGGGDGPGEGAGVVVDVRGREGEGAVDVFGTAEGLGGQQGRVIDGSDDDVDLCFGLAVRLAAAVADDDAKVVTAVVVQGRCVGHSTSGIDAGLALGGCCAEREGEGIAVAVAGDEPSGDRGPLWCCESHRLDHGCVVHMCHQQGHHH